MGNCCVSTMSRTTEPVELLHQRQPSPQLTDSSATGIEWDTNYSPAMAAKLVGLLVEQRPADQFDLELNALSAFERESLAIHSPKSVARATRTFKSMLERASIRISVSASSMRLPLGEAVDYTLRYANRSIAVCEGRVCLVLDAGR